LPQNFLHKLKLVFSDCLESQLGKRNGDWMMEQADRFLLSAGSKRLLLLLALLASAAGLVWIRASFASPQIYQKDFLSGYLLAKALLSGGNPYLPIQELANLWMPQTNFTNFNHPSPHTIAIGWLCAPFALLPYESAARAWLVFELGCLLGAIALLLRGFGCAWSWRTGLGALILSLGWAPVMQDLWFGQFSIVLLLLLLWAWLALREGQDWRGGLLLGAMLTLKLTGWPIVLFLLLRRRWQAVTAAGLTVAFFHLLAVGLHGWGLVRDYYLKIGPEVSAHYHWRDPNSSLWTFGQRMFAEYGNNFLSQPPWPSPGLARAVDVLVPLMVLVISLWLAARLPEFDSAFALLACVSAIINPVAWTHYLMLTVVAIGVIVQRLHSLGWPRSWVKRLLLVCAPFCVTHPIWSLLAILFSQAGLSERRPVVPFAAAWLTVTPTLAVLALCWLLWRISNLAAQPARLQQPDDALWSAAEPARLAAS
jgi:hypothetical protein